MMRILSFAAAFAILAFLAASASVAASASKPGKASRKPIHHKVAVKPAVIADGCEVDQIQLLSLPSIPLGGGQKLDQVKFLLWSACWVPDLHWKWNFSFPGSNFASTSSTDAFPVVNVPAPGAVISGTITVSASGKTPATCKFTFNGPDPPRLPEEPIFPPHGFWVC
jgi:hypothetical protein